MSLLLLLFLDIRGGGVVLVFLMQSPTFSPVVGGRCGPQRQVVHDVLGSWLCTVPFLNFVLTIVYEYSWIMLDCVRIVAAWEPVLSICAGARVFVLVGD